MTASKLRPTHAAASHWDAFVTDIQNCRSSPSFYSSNKTNWEKGVGRCLLSSGPKPHPRQQYTVIGQYCIYRLLCHGVGIEQARFRMDHSGDRKHPAPDSSYHAISPFALPPRGGHQMTRGIQCNSTGMVLDPQELMRKGMAVTPRPRPVRLRDISVPGRRVHKESS